MLLTQGKKVEGHDSPDATTGNITSSNDSSSIEDVDEHLGSSMDYDEAGVPRNADPDRSSPNNIPIAESLSKAVLRSKLFVYTVIVLLAGATALGTWRYVHEDETSKFENQFVVYADDLIAGAFDKAMTMYKQINTLSMSVTSYAIDTDRSWPMVSIPHFYKWTSNFGDLLGTSLILFAPVVNISKKTEWLEWVASHSDEILFDTFDPKVAKPTDLVQNIQVLGEDVVANTNLTLLSDETTILPALQYGPTANSSGLINVDLNSHPAIQRALRQVLMTKMVVFTELIDVSFLLDYTQGTSLPVSNRRSIMMEPVFDSFDSNLRSVVGVVMAVEAWSNYFRGNRPEEVENFIVDIDDSCGDDMTFLVSGEESEFLGHDNHHDPKYDYIARRVAFSTQARYVGSDEVLKICNYSLAVYPSNEFESKFHTNTPVIYVAALLCVFVVTSLVFAMYDWMVKRRQEEVMGTAQRTTALVHSLFPKSVGDRLIAEESEKAQFNKDRRIERFQRIAEETTKASYHYETSDPIADLFTSTTIMFADIVGFTAWSSTREPKQVFTLLETIYSEFDAQTKRYRVFKVETVGDCYVAVAGLPHPRKDHAVVMARFAHECMCKFQVLCSQLEVSLGPDTADLALRVGLHSGPVTAGVLRGERARFQLFGDTMNTTSRMEATSRPNKIHISQETADLLTEANKGHWCHKRTDIIEAKGKGKMQTFWLNRTHKESLTLEYSNENEDQNILQSDPMKLHDGQRSNSIQSSILMSNAEAVRLRQKKDRLILWNVEILTKFLVQLQEHRLNSGAKPDSSEKIRSSEMSITNNGSMVLDEIEEVIQLPPYKSSLSSEVCESSEVPEKAKSQLFDFVTDVASFYNENPFHNFEHASHVTMSVVKLMSRIVAPSLDVNDDKTVDSDQILHDHTYGITSDPLIQFASALSALIHDMDHCGVPNTQLVKEQSHVATRYQNRSVAEQNSIDLAWKLLMEQRYTDLRSAIYCNVAEAKRFRQLLVNSVMATDIVDKELSAQRKQRWQKAFSEDSSIFHVRDSPEAVNRKATIVLEHLIQASDVAHTMQHFQVYQKWNANLFQEMYQAFKHGRAEKDPSEFWYNGEIGFFDFYIIPLAKKLKDCGVFGVSGDENLNYATRNRREWAARGHQIVAEFKESALRAYVKTEQKAELDLKELKAAALKMSREGETERQGGESFNSIRSESGESGMSFKENGNSSLEEGTITSADMFTI